MFLWLGLWWKEKILSWPSSDNKVWFDLTAGEDRCDILAGIQCLTFWLDGVVYTLWPLCCFYTNIQRVTRLQSILHNKGQLQDLPTVNEVEHKDLVKAVEQEDYGEPFLQEIPLVIVRFNRQDWKDAVRDCEHETWGEAPHTTTAW